jgi:hypothetical protein
MIDWGLSWFVPGALMLAGGLRYNSGLEANQTRACGAVVGRMGLYTGMAAETMGQHGKSGGSQAAVVPKEQPASEGGPYKTLDLLRQPVSGETRHRRGGTSCFGWAPIRRARRSRKAGSSEANSAL